MILNKIPIKVSKALSLHQSKVIHTRHRSIPFDLIENSKPLLNISNQNRLPNLIILKNFHFECILLIIRYHAYHSHCLNIEKKYYIALDSTKSKN